MGSTKHNKIRMARTIFHAKAQRRKVQNREDEGCAWFEAVIRWMVGLFFDHESTKTRNGRQGFTLKGRGTAKGHEWTQAGSSMRSNGLGVRRCRSGAETAYRAEKALQYRNPLLECDL